MSVQIKTHTNMHTHEINDTLTHTIKQHEQIYKRLSRRSATAIEEHDWQM